MTRPHTTPRSRFIVPLLCMAWLAIVLLTVVAHANAQEQAIALPYAQRPEVIEFIDTLASTYGLERAWLEQTLNQARYSEQAEKLNTPALTPPWQSNWNEYRARNVNEQRIRLGVEFMRAHRATLRRAQAQWGVPVEIITAILGVETIYGRIKGRLRALDVLTTLSFDYTRRAALFREELMQYLLWCREQGIDPTTPRSSFAAAMGLPQFMPSSVRLYAVDFDGDGRIDLSQSVPDAIGSVAAFLSAQGWQADAPILLKVHPSPSLVERADQGIEPQRTWHQLAMQDVHLQDEPPLAPDTPVLLIELANGMNGTNALPGTPEDPPPSQWRIGTPNFAALLQYNRSYFYAASVAELAQALRERAAQSAAADRTRQ